MKITHPFNQLPSRVFQWQHKRKLSFTPRQEHKLCFGKVHGFVLKNVHTVFCEKFFVRYFPRIIQKSSKLISLLIWSQIKKYSLVYRFLLLN